MHLSLPVRASCSAFPHLQRCCPRAYLAGSRSGLGRAMGRMLACMEDGQRRCQLTPSQWLLLNHLSSQCKRQRAMTAGDGRYPMLSLRQSPFPYRTRSCLLTTLQTHYWSLIRSALSVAINWAMGHININSQSVTSVHSDHLLSCSAACPAGQTLAWFGGGGACGDGVRSPATQIS